jgi:S1-C subfamily serine protease
MDLLRIERTKIVGLLMPAVLLLALACSVPVANAPSEAPTPTIQFEQVSTPAGSVAPIQTLLAVEATEPTSIADSNEPAKPALRPQQAAPDNSGSAQVQQVQLDADAIVAAFEEVIGRVHDDVLPSVVQIRVTQKITADSEPPDFGFPSPFENSPLPSPAEPDFFFREGEGSGFVWSDEGYIVTNQHVVANADTVSIKFANGTEVEGVVVGEDPDSDLAVLKVDLPKDMLPPVALGDSNDVRVGQVAVAIGNPFGQEFTTTTGIVSAIGRTIRSGNTRFSVPKVIQTDAPINPGNSGGPLLNRKGQVIGINTQILSRTGASTGIGFAVPVNTAKQVIPVLIEDGKFIYAWLGISGADLRKEVAEAMDINPDVRGAQVIDLAPGGPAEKGGLRGSDRTQEVDRGLIPAGGDVIVSINDIAIADMDDLIIYLIENARPGDTIILNVVRDGGERSKIEVILGSRPE